MSAPVPDEFPPPPHCWGCAPGDPLPIGKHYLHHQRKRSDDTFGPGRRTEGVIDHIRKELVEVEQASNRGGERLAEWLDVIILALDGATREARALGLDVGVVLDDVAEKQARNERREWPDWRIQPEGQAIEHDRSQPLCQAVIDHPRFGPQKCLAPLPCNHSDPRYFARAAEAALNKEGP